MVNGTTSSWTEYAIGMGTITESGNIYGKVYGMGIDTVSNGSLWLKSTFYSVTSMIVF